MGAWAPLAVRLKPLLMQIRSGRDQCEHVLILWHDQDHDRVD